MWGAMWIGRCRRSQCWQTARGGAILCWSESSRTQINPGHSGSTRSDTWPGRASVWERSSNWPKLDRFPEDLLEVAGTSMTRTMNVRLREEAEQFFPVPPLADGKAVPQMTELLVYVGDPERGKEVFEKAECSTCHLIEGTGTEFGPDLSRIGEKLPKAGLYQAILDPSAGIASNYRLFYFTLRDGQEVSGFILGETPDKLTLRLEGGVLSEYSSSDLVSWRESSVSAMPSDLQRQISVDELVDLVEYLTTQQSVVGSKVSQQNRFNKTYINSL